MVTRRSTQIRLVALAACALALPACANDQATQTPSPPAASDAASAAAVAANGFHVATEAVGMIVQASADGQVAAPGTDVSIQATTPEITPSTTTSAASSYVTASLPAVQVTLGDGQQPNAPITLTFTPADPAYMSSLSDTVVPVLLVDGTDPATAGMVLASKSPDGKSITATTHHLSTFSPVALDAAALYNAAWKQQAQRDATGECRTTDQSTGGTVTIEAKSAKPDVLDACASVSGSNLTVGFTSHDPLYLSLSTDGDAVGNATITSAQGTSDQAAAILNRLTSKHSLGLVPPQGTASLTVPIDAAPSTIHVDASPVATQLETVLTGLGMLGIDSKVLDAVLATKGGIDCQKSVKDATADASPDAAAAAGHMMDLASCLNDSASTAKLAEKTLLQKTGTLLSVFYGLPKQFIANVHGITSELNGSAHFDISVLRTPTGSDATPTGGGWISMLDMAPVFRRNGSESHDSVTISTTDYPRSMEGTYPTGGSFGDDSNRLIYTLAGKCDRFETFIGMDARSSNAGKPGRFRIWLDDSRLVTDRTMAMNQQAQKVILNTSGASRITLQIDRGTNDGLGVWGTPRFHCSANPNPTQR